MPLATFTRELESIARRGRRLLVFQRVLQFLAVALPTALTLGLIDFALRLPGWLRAVMLLSLLAVAGVWLFSHIGRALRFRPTPVRLAMRLEKLYPHLKGVLASAVQFHMNPQAYADHPASQTLVDRSTREAEAVLGTTVPGRLIDSSRTGRVGAAVVVAVLALASVAAGFPESAEIAAKRWALPFGATAWPLRQHVEDRTEDKTWPDDAKVRLLAEVTQGSSDGLRVRLDYRVDRLDDGETVTQMQSLLLRQQDAALFGGRSGWYEALLDVPSSARRELSAGAPALALRYRFSAGDDEGSWQTRRLAQRPEAVSVVATLNPPAYAQGLVSSTQRALHEQTDRTAAMPGLAGSLAELLVTLNKPIPEPVQPVMEGLVGVPGLELEYERDPAGAVTAVRARFPLQGAVETGVALTDAEGLSNVSQRRYRLEAQADRPPVIALVEPLADESVLPTARLELSATGEDDVGLTELGFAVGRLDGNASMPEAAEDPESPGVELAPFGEPVLDPTWIVPGPSARLSHVSALDLLDLSAVPGEVFTVRGMGRDGFVDAQGEPRGPVYTDARRFLVIDQARFESELSLSLAALQRDVKRLQRQQAAAQRIEPDAAATEQRRIGQGVRGQLENTGKLDQRVQRNRFDDPEIAELLELARRLLNEGSEASGQARESMQQSDQARREAEAAAREAEEALEAGNPEQAQQQAALAQQARQQQEQAEARGREQQQQAEQALRELATALDQGGALRDVKRAAEELRRQQAEAAQEARQLLPATIGRTPEQLPEEVKAQLEALAARQAQLAREAQQLLQESQTAARTAQERGNTPEDRATASVLQDLVDIGRREGLEPTMEEAAQELQNSRLSQASPPQEQALATLDRMLEALGQREEKLAEELRRRLADLAQRIRQLIEQQEAEIASLEQTLEDGRDLPPLAEPQRALRRRTIAVETLAAESDQTAEVAEPLARAVTAQAEAVKALRAADGEAAESGQAKALQELQEALRLVQEKQDEQQQDENAAERAKLIAAYRALADEQKALRERIEPIAALDVIPRRQRQRLAQAGTEQDAIRTKAAELGEKSADTLVFKQVHENIDTAASRAGDTLGRQQADAGLVRDQTRVESLLRHMADALEQEMFNDGFQQQQQGGGGSGPTPLIPPVAEVKLLRALQADLQAMTQQLQAQDQPEDGPEKQAYVDELRGLSAQQRSLQKLGREMVQKFAQSMGGGRAEPEASE